MMQMVVKSINQRQILKKFRQIVQKGNQTKQTQSRRTKTRSDFSSKAQCGDYRTLLSHFFGKNLVKPTFSL